MGKVTWRSARYAAATPDDDGWMEGCNFALGGLEPVQPGWNLDLATSEVEEQRRANPRRGTMAHIARPVLGNCHAARTAMEIAESLVEDGTINEVAYLAMCDLVKRLHARLQATEAEQSQSATTSGRRRRRAEVEDDDEDDEGAVASMPRREWVPIVTHRVGGREPRRPALWAL